MGKNRAGSDFFQEEVEGEEGGEIERVISNMVVAA